MEKESRGKKIVLSIADYFRSIPTKTKSFFQKQWVKAKSFGANIADFFAQSDWKVLLSLLFCGAGNIAYGQYAKGIMFLLLEAFFVVYMVLLGGDYLVGLVTLGTKESDPWSGVVGDNSVVLMLMGILTVFIILCFLLLYLSSLRSALSARLTKLKGQKPRTFMEDVASLAGRKFPYVALFVPLLGVMVFSVIPIVMMILVAFTNFGGEIEVPTDLVDYVGFDNFATIFGATNIGTTFFKIFGWNLAWAFLSTFINYFLGLGLALLLSKKCVKGSAFWRAFPILAYAIPGFITLIGFKFMFSTMGPINYYLSDGHMHDSNIIDFLGLDSTWWARGIGLFVNAWLTVPTTMLLATGILSNIQKDLYEAADIDGASKRKQFFDITLPYVIFATTPTLISQFIGNFNNFGTFYFLRGGIVSEGYFLASDTDLLINWLYNLSISKNYYGIGAAISLLIFIITSAISLLVYVRSGSYKKEDTYR